MEIHKIKLKYSTTFFSARVVDDWKRLPRKVVVSPFFDIIKTKLEKAPSNPL